MASHVGVSGIVVLEEGKMASTVKLDDEAEQEILSSWRLLSSKPNLIVCNVDVRAANRLNRACCNVPLFLTLCAVQEAAAASGNAHTETVAKYLQAENDGRSSLYVCARLEAEAMIFEEDPVKRRDIYASYGMEDSALSALINKTFEKLGMICYYTAGPREARAWPIRKGATARAAAGEIHSDMEKGFIKAETISYDDFVKGSRKARLEGPNYVVQEGTAPAAARISTSTS